MNLSSHRSIEFAVGLVVGLVPVVLAVTDSVDASAAAIVIAGALGIALITMGIATTREGNAVEPQSHASLDRLMIAALLVAGVVLGVAGDAVIGAFLVGGGAVQLAVTLLTTYAGRGSQPGEGTTTTTTS